MIKRFPAEWEEQDGVLLAWPHQWSDWRSHLHIVEPVFVEIAVKISWYETVIITAPDPDPVRTQLERAGAVMERVVLHGIESNDTWARDFGPLTVLEDGRPVLIDFVFNGWGLKFAAHLDNLVSRRLAAAGVFSAPLNSNGMVLEGGSIESDGKGTIMTTYRCLLSPNRNPHLSRTEIESELSRALGVDRVLWLGSGHLAGDDTDSHIDTLARFCPDDTIIHVACVDPSDEHFQEIRAMVAELEGFRTIDGRPYRLLPLPWPKAVFEDNGERLPATYANFLVLNGAVLVPTYRDPGDKAALRCVSDAFPGRDIIGINSFPLIMQHGSLHCVTMQLPKGTISNTSKGA